MTAPDPPPEPYDQVAAIIRAAPYAAALCAPVLLAPPRPATASPDPRPDAALEVNDPAPSDLQLKPFEPV